MAQTDKTLRETPSQTAGPYVHIGLAPARAGIEIYDMAPGDSIAGPKAKGTRITVTGCVLDGTGTPVADALIEVWQADASGRYSGADNVAKGFHGWGRVVPDFKTGAFILQTIKPGPVAMGDGRTMAPHLNLWLVARGINIGLQTRMYFADEPNANDADPVLQQIKNTADRNTLIAQKTDGGYHFDIVLQGAGETVFFDF